MSCLASWREKGNQVLGTTFCPVQVASDNDFYKSDDTLHRYGRYQEVYPTWSISPDKTAECYLYWKWFVGKYPDALAREFNANPPRVQSQWSTTKWHDVKANLKDIIYNL